MKLGFQEINPKDLVPCPIQLRPVRKHTLEYEEVKDSIKVHGVLVTLLVRVKDGQLEVVDGAHRLAIAMDLRLDTVPCMVRKITDHDVHYIQVAANAARVETRVADYAHRLWKIIEFDKSLTLNEVAHALHKNVDWLKRILGLVELCPQANEALKEHQLSVSAAIEIAKLPFGIQNDMLNLAGSIPATEFIELARQKVRAVRSHRLNDDLEEKAQVRNDLKPELRLCRTLAEEWANPSMAASVIIKTGAESPVEIWQAALSYALCVDPDSLEIRRKKRDRDR